MTKKVQTFKSGSFVFSLNYNKSKLTELIVKSEILYRTVADVPILPNLAAGLEEDLIKKSIFGTAAIEGNPLSEEDVNKMLSQEKIEGKLIDPQKQIQNLREAYQIIKQTQYSRQPIILEEKLIKSIHEIITKDSESLENIPGKYRNHPVKVGDEAHGGVYAPPKILEDIKKLMKHYIEWINSPEVLKEDAFIRACLAHYYLALIHPFDNGNGRTSRAIEAILLKSAGIKFVPHMLSNFYYKNLNDYFIAFSMSEKNDCNDITPFVEFYLTGLIDSLEEIKARIFSWIREFTLRDYYEYLRREKQISQRQFDLLVILLRFKEEFTLKDLFEKDIFKIIYRNVGERTAMRDLKILLENSLLEAIKKNTYILNLNVLG
ncbi:MAG: Fic family protein [Candidatus Aureabacteria bacterium]|nr:Fic family protein [Candidatus Auribacterota bacterium]